MAPFICHYTPKFIHVLPKWVQTNLCIRKCHICITFYICKRVQINTPGLVVWASLQILHGPPKFFLKIPSLLTYSWEKKNHIKPPMENCRSDTDYNNNIYDNCSYDVCWKKVNLETDFDLKQKGEILGLRHLIQHLWGLQAMTPTRDLWWMLDAPPMIKVCSLDL